MSDEQTKTPPSASWDLMIDYLSGNLSGNQQFSETYTENFLLPTGVLVGRRIFAAKKKLTNPVDFLSETRIMKVLSTT